MIVKLLLFAAAKEIAGAEQMEVSLDDEATIGDLKQFLADKHPSLKDLIDKSTFAVDQEYVRDEKVLYHEAEVGFIPPVSGG
ncbi:MAG: molybdopterin converting factor subunit 1 [Planctomycetota bacterium]